VFVTDNPNFHKFINKKKKKKKKKEEEEERKKKMTQKCNPFIPFNKNIITLRSCTSYFRNTKGKKIDHI
jgi:hypothetical protein